jgi:L-cysteate sulfo-lyase
MIEPVSLGTWPTPLEAAPRLAARLGLAELWFKRDDLNGLGGGGNKIRKLQYTCAEALASGAVTVATSGAPQSNHARLTAAAAARLGLSCVLVLDGPPVEERRGNLLLDELAGAAVVWADGRPREEVLATEAEKWAAHVIPFGGSSPTSVQGYVDCGRELRAQVSDIDAAEVVVAVGSGGTMRGTRGSTWTRPTPAGRWRRC